MLRKLANFFNTDSNTSQDDVTTGLITKRDTNSSTSYLLKEADVTLSTQQLGSGAFSNVYRGKWKKHAVAVKTMLYSTEQADLAVFAKEINLLKKLTELNAPNIVKFYGYTKSALDTKYTIVMEFLPKGSLFDFIASNRSALINWHTRYKIMTDITRGVAFLHGVNILHCDIKPGNVLLDKKLEAKICDFGAANAPDSGDNYGTELYLAPEAGHAKDYTDKADVFSLCLTMWCTAAWNINDDATQYARCHNKKPTTPRKCSPKLARLITLGLADKKEDRPSSAELLSELSSARPALY